MNTFRLLASLAVVTFLAFGPMGTVPFSSNGSWDSPAVAHGGEPVVAKRIVRGDQAGENLLGGDAWRAYERGFTPDGKSFLCDNSADPKARRGVSQTVELNQTRPEPIVATVWSKAEGVTGSPGSDYSLYLDLTYADGTPLWGQTANFKIGTHDWQRGQVVLLPEKPVKRLSFHLLLRGHGGKAWFRDPELRVVKTPAGACLFDGQPVVPTGPASEGFQVRDVATGGDFVHVTDPDTGPSLGKAHEALGIEFDQTSTRKTDVQNATFTEINLSDTTGKDRAVTLVFTLPVEGKSLRWLDDPRRNTAVEPGREYVSATSFHAGNGRLSRWPLAAVAAADAKRGVALAVDPQSPVFCRLGYSAGTGELFVACDIGMAHEKPRATVRLCRFTFDPKWGFRGVLARYYELFPAAFETRVTRQGQWMPFAKISEVKGWEDFGFRIKEGDNETRWDDEHGILTFRYTEPMTWWMAMPKDMPRTLDAALAEARRLADQGRPEAKALLTSGYHDADGRFAARLLDTPWCNGAVWSVNSMPGIAGAVTDFKNKWNPQVRERLYGPKRQADLDGEYIDSSEGYVTDELDFRRDHLAVAETPLVFSPVDHRPAIFRGLVAFEYVRGIERDVHRDGRLMMANGAPTRLWWLAPLLDVMGTETDWRPGGRWQPMSDAEMLYRRAMCKGKPYCFLMNTRFEDFPPELVEKYMKRSLAYGMFPGFFSHNASQGHYFTRPELFGRDRPLFKKYVPLCRRVAEAGWEPVTLARSDDEHVYVERFGRRWLTVFNDSPQPRTATITLDGLDARTAVELLSGRAVAFHDGKTTVALGGEDVAVLEVLELP